MATKYKFLEARFNPATKLVRVDNSSTAEVWYYGHPLWTTLKSVTDFEEVEIEALATYLVEFYSKVTRL